MRSSSDQNLFPENKWFIKNMMKNLSNSMRVKANTFEAKCKEMTKLSDPNPNRSDIQNYFDFGGIKYSFAKAICLMQSRIFSYIWKVESYTSFTARFQNGLTRQRESVSTFLEKKFTKYEKLENANK